MQAKGAAVDVEHVEKFARRSLLLFAPLALVVPLRWLEASPVSLGQPLSCVSAQLIDGILRCDRAHERRALCPGPTLFDLNPGDAVHACTIRRMPPADLAALAQPVDLNAAPPEELASLPGIGPALSARIVAGRPYATVDELVRVKGVGPKRLDAMRARAMVSTSARR